MSSSVPGGPSLSCGSAHDHRGAAADPRVCPAAGSGGHPGGGPALALPGRRLERPQVGLGHLGGLRSAAVSGRIW